jgi:hypothetical protein
MAAPTHARFCALAGVLAASLASLGLFGGCRNILGIEEREFDATLADGGSDGATEPELTCDSYCDLIQGACQAGNSQYSSRDSCMGFCSTLPPGTLDDQSGNTLGCRINAIDSAKAMIEISDCAAGGPGGNGVCGSNCDAYCHSILTVCPGDFDSSEDCMTACTPLIECGPYYVDTSSTPDDPSIQCRLYHISAAATGILNPPAGGGLASSQVKHCPHAVGDTECIVPPVGETPMCP